MTRGVSESHIAKRLSTSFANRLAAEDVAAALTPQELSYLAENLHRTENVSLVWAAMDAAWHATNADFRPGAEAAIARFYASPVWLLNGIFTEIDPESEAHRVAIADFVASQRPAFIAEYGGGLGSLARHIADTAPTAKVLVVEPYPTRLALRLAQQYPNLTYEATLPEGADVVIAQDVLEHVTDPLADFALLLGSVRLGGLVITANCFQPVIQCHFPGALHFHFTFRHIAPLLGCQFEGAIDGALHAHIFRKTGKQPKWRAARILEKLSKLAFPVMLAAQGIKRSLSRPVSDATGT